MDKDGGGSLDENEINDLVQSLGITLTTEQLDTAIKEMDSDGGRTVAYEEFKEWWYLKKHGRPVRSTPFYPQNPYSTAFYPQNLARPQHTPRAGLCGAHS